MAYPVRLLRKLRRLVRRMFLIIGRYEMNKHLTLNQ
jgi:hypothetical protein